MDDKLFAICRGLSRRFPEGNNPFQMMTRLLEEAGELAKEVNHFEGSGVKNEKYGLPDEAHLVKEIRQAVCCALQVAIYYGIEDKLKADIDNYFIHLEEEGWIKE